ncbi:hypothetical protein HG536_0C05430 [Torulaspora globosa]|uniref:ATPase inhibitor, mitochondrial n=1 Tax=Torulaspora globosa TaxID=48254 RepID=A0A7G3ZFT8_9SACH|nr:uncharacterized protein HG536_0C05430 [Torulaspora globosa]QLL32374.1 hypothetical protein HG536_0C05430 [Torulaspora globosa]
MLSRSSTVARTLRLQGGVAARMYSDSSNVGPLGTGPSEDSFIKRERAKEDYFVRQHEKEQLQKLRKQLKEHQDKVDSLKNKIESLSKR